MCNFFAKISGYTVTHHTPVAPQDSQRFVPQKLKNVTA